MSKSSIFSGGLGPTRRAKPIFASSTYHISTKIRGVSDVGLGWDEKLSYKVVKPLSLHYTNIYMTNMIRCLCIFFLQYHCIIIKLIFKWYKTKTFFCYLIKILIKFFLSLKESFLHNLLPNKNLYSFVVKCIEFCTLSFPSNLSLILTLN